MPTYRSSSRRPSRTRAPRTRVYLRYGLGPLRFTTPITGAGCSAAVLAILIPGALALVVFAVIGLISFLHQNSWIVVAALAAVGALLAGFVIAGLYSSRNDAERAQALRAAGKLRRFGKEFYLDLKDPIDGSEVTYGPFKSESAAVAAAAGYGQFAEPS